MKFTYVLFGFLLCSVSVCLGAKDYYFSNLSLKDGLSQITVLAICQDSHGYLWFGTRNGLNKFNGYTFEKYYHDAQNDNSLTDNYIHCLVEDNDGNLWIGTNNGLSKMDLSTNKITQYFAEDGNDKSLSNNMIYALCKDENGDVWIGTINGLNVYDKKTDTFKHYFLDEKLRDNAMYTMCCRDGTLFMGTYQGVIAGNFKNGEKSKHYPNPNHVRSICVDDNKKLWIGTQDKGLFIENEDGFVNITAENGLSNNYVRSIVASPDGKQMLIGTSNGLNVIDLESLKITMQYKNYDNDDGVLSHFSIQSMFFDPQNTLWVGTYAGGVNYCSTFGARFRYFNPAEKTDQMTGVIGQSVETTGYLYFATEGGGLLEMNKQTGAFRTYLLFPDENAYPKNILKSVYLDGNRILCGTNLGVIYSFDLKSKRFSLFHDFKSQIGIYYIGRNLENEIIVGCVDPIGMVIIKDGNVQPDFPLKDGKSIAFRNMRCFSEIEKNIFLIGTRNDGLFLYDRNTFDMQQFTTQYFAEKKYALPENYITTLFRDSRNRIWIGTFGGGFCLFDLTTKYFTNFNVSDGLHNNNVCAIVEDNNGHLWISAISGISDFNPADRSFRNYTYSNGIKVNEFTPHTGMKTSDGQIIFSGNNGFVMFNPNEISYNPTAPAILLENLFINNSKVEIGSKTLPKALSEQKEIVLKYNQTNFSIEYVALNFIFSNKNKYAYKMEGFDAEWNEVGTRRMAYYTNIPSGAYIFKVKAANNDGVWSDTAVEMVIKVLPPPWKSGWAYLLYFIVLASILYFIYQYFAEKKRFENELKIQQAEAKAQQEFNAERSRLFTNFSHELRAPLTLIISPLNDLSEHSGNLTQEQTGKIAIMKNNAQRLLRLVNNLMDFRKNESGMLKPKLVKSDFVAFAREMTLNFKEMATSREIDFRFNTDVKEIFMSFDKNLMEKVFFNFLSNAFKNTPDGGEVAVSLFVPHPGAIRFEIRDSGVGVPEPELEKIFQPFYQVAQNEYSASGTGLGLSLSKSIIEMHSGKVWAENNEDRGATFQCILPTDKTGSDENDYTKCSNIAETGTKKKHVILVVEDNFDVRDYIVSHLNTAYNVIQASNGEEACEKAVNHLPDLIISDVVMPRMDGITMAQTLKNDIRTGHIPIILLTAKVLPEDQTEGYNIGADDYIVKPFNSSVLLARVKNLLAVREKLKEIYGKRFSIENFGIETTSADERFIQKLYEVMDKNISNPDFKLDEFSREIGMSKANLYRKIKSVTNFSPNEFIRNFRLETAAKILKNTDLPVSEIYVAVGFNSHAYFSNCFKTLYGISPTEFAESSRRRN
ncbi:MAG: response regulator [Dysgonamonadaceae bacterium]|jgi:signal transduction histidine kinase/ligand-binding sensor domain-containing protein/DNA-binding response OmpR family regulator|nr:response regulator [Dysgonamonadaceae bacterium]